MGIKRLLSTVLLAALLMSCGRSNEDSDYNYVFLDLATLYGSYNGGEVSEVIRNASFGEKAEIIEQINDFSKVKMDGKEVYILTDALMDGENFDVLKKAFEVNEKLQDKVYTSQGRRALVLALQGFSDQTQIIPSRPDPTDGYFIHYAFDITDKNSDVREYFLFGANDMESTPVKLYSISIPNDAAAVEEIEYTNGKYLI